MSAGNIKDEIIIEKLNQEHILLDFDCRDEEVNNYFNERSFNDVVTRNAQIYVFLKENKIIGFFSLSMKSVYMDIEGEKKSWPVALIGQLGINVDSQSQGWGKYLVNIAIGKAKKISEDIGCTGVIVETYKEDLTVFYEKLGFRSVKKDSIKGKGIRNTYFYKFKTNG